MDERDAGRCRECGGRITATHLLLRTYPVDERGRWQRSFTDFAEDIIIACAMCAAAPLGRVQGCADRFCFVPAR